jgi:hypothetical protein
LQSFGRFGVPVDMVYGPGAPAGIALPEPLTPGTAMDAFRAASTAASDREAQNELLSALRADGQLSASLSKFGFFDLHKGDKSKLTPLSDTDFYIAGRYQTRLSFTRDSSGQVTGAVVNPGPWEQAGIRASN